MKKNIIFLLAVALIFPSCSHWEKEEVINTENTEMSVQEIQFMEKEQDVMSPKDILAKIPDTVFEENPEHTEMINSILFSEIERLFVDKAKKMNDVSVCSEIWDVASQENCENKYYEYMAWENNDTAFCEKITSSLKKNCIKTTVQNKALQELNPDICEELQTDDVQAWEWEDIYSDVNFCTSRVYFEKALADKDVKVCENILIDIEKEMCVDVVSREQK